MPCLERAKGLECPYRKAIGCGSADRAEGIALGRCIFEAARRQQFIEAHDPLLEWVPEDERQRFAVAVVRVSDAVLYAARSRTWEAAVFDREVAKPPGARDYFGSTEVRTARRYSEGGSLRLLRTYADLRPMLEEIGVRRRAGAVAKAQAAARAIVAEKHPEAELPMKLATGNATT